jgi:hypothetical protein
MPRVHSGGTRLLPGTRRANVGGYPAHRTRLLHLYMTGRFTTCGTPETEALTCYALVSQRGDHYSHNGRHVTANLVLVSL